MNRKNFLTTALLGFALAVLPRRSEGAYNRAHPMDGAASVPRQCPAPSAVDVDRAKRARHAEVVAKWLDDSLEPVATWVDDVAPPAPKLSGISLPYVSVWCQCPACNGSGFRGEDRDQCGYCGMAGRLVTTEIFGMYNAEGNAEVWRALVWHEWSQRNWKEGDGPQPWLPGMLYYIGQQHPEVYDTVVREYIFEWLEKRFDKAHAEAQAVAFVAEVERNNRQDEKLKHLYERDDKIAIRAIKPTYHPGYVDMGGTHRIVWHGSDGVLQSSFNDWDFHSEATANAEAESCRKLFPSLKISVEGRARQTA